MVNHFTRKGWVSLSVRRRKMRWLKLVGTNRFARFEGFLDALTTFLKALVVHRVTSDTLT